MKIVHDLHIHTNYSACCMDKNLIPEKVAEYSIERGMKTIGFCDHIWQSKCHPPSVIAEKYHESRIVKLKNKLDHLSCGIKILAGCEAETISPKNFSIESDFAEKIDYVMMSANHFHLNCIAQPKDDSDTGYAQHMLNMYRAAMRFSATSIIAHPVIPMSCYDRFDSIIATVSDNEFTELFAETAEREVAFEITVNYLPYLKPGREFSIDTPFRIVELAKQARCKFTFASDAHTLNQLEWVDRLQLFINKLGLTEEDLHPLMTAK